MISLNLFMLIILTVIKSTDPEESEFINLDRLISKADGYLECQNAKFSNEIQTVKKTLIQQSLASEESRCIEEVWAPAEEQAEKYGSDSVSCSIRLRKELMLTYKHNKQLFSVASFLQHFYHRVDICKFYSRDAFNTMIKRLSDSSQECAHAKRK